MRIPVFSFWLRVREFAAPPSMIESATARRAASDWAGACAAGSVHDLTACPRKIGDIANAALILTHFEHRYVSC
jgi:hypothetical protein